MLPGDTIINDAVFVKIYRSDDKAPQLPSLWRSTLHRVRFFIRENLFSVFITKTDGNMSMSQ